MQGWTDLGFSRLGAGEVQKKNAKSDDFFVKVD